MSMLWSSARANSGPPCFRHIVARPVNGRSKTAEGGPNGLSWPASGKVATRTARRGVQRLFNVMSGRWGDTKCRSFPTFE
eukprot:198193-Alexandrium_andersonii.AAC.1